MDRGEALFDLGRFADARKEYLSALQSDPDDSEALSMVAVCCIQLDELPEARRFAQSAAAADPEDSFARQILSQVLLLQNDPIRSEAEARESLRLAPWNPSAHAMLAGSFLVQRKWKEALESAMEALELDPDNSYAHQVRQEALMAMGRKKEAEAAAAEHLRSRPDDPVAHEAKGRLLLQTGQHESAVETLRDSLRLDPTNEDARDSLKAAMASRFPPYRWMVQYQALLSRLPPGTGLAVIVGLSLAGRTLRNLSKTYPQYMPYLMAGGTLCSAILWFSMSIQLIGLMILLLKADGRMAMSKSERDFSVLGWSLIGILLAGSPAFLFVGTGAAVLFGAACLISFILAALLQSTSWTKVKWPLSLGISILLVGAGVVVALTANKG